MEPEMTSALSATYIDHMGSDKKIAQAARTSTKGMDNDQPKIEGLVKALWRDGHMCFDAETEVLTRSGWKRWPDVSPDDEMLSLNLDSGESEYVKQDALHAYDYSGDMVHFKTPSVDMLVTPNHRLVAATLKGQGWSKYRLMRADELLDKPFRIAGAAGSIVNQSGVVSEREAELLGFVMGDGHVPHDGRTGSPNFHLHKQRKVEYLGQLVSGMRGMELRGGECGKFRLCGVPPRLKALMIDTYCEDGTRRVPPALLAGASAAEAAAFVRGYLEADGSLRRDRGGSYSLSSAGESCIQGISQLAATVGLRVNIGKPQSTSRSTFASRHTHLQCAILASERNSNPRIGWTLALRAEQVKRVNYSGKVYCSTVKHGTLYVRRGGRANWSGNSPFEHCALTVALDVPLFVRDQVVRHKSMSFSVMSGRYTEFKPRFYAPPRERPLVQTGKALDYRREPGNDSQYMTSLARHVAAATEGLWSYHRLIGAGVANEVARNVLPASVYTQMWVTGTLRSWLHFLDQRLDEHAQWEVRQVAEQVAEIIRHIFPIAYQAWTEKRAT